MAGSLFWLPDEAWSRICWTKAETGFGKVKPANDPTRKPPSTFAITAYHVVRRPRLRNQLA